MRDSVNACDEKFLVSERVYTKKPDLHPHVKDPGLVERLSGVDQFYDLTGPYGPNIPEVVAYLSLPFVTS